MSDRPVFVFVAAYPDREAAMADYDDLLELHDDKLVGTYDIAIIDKDAEGKVHVTKHEKPTQHGAWGGIAVGALLGVVFPPSVLGTAAVGGVLGGVGAHLRKGLSRGDVKELGELLDAGEAAVVVIGESRVEENFEKALARAERTVEKEIDADSKDLAREIEKAEKETAGG